eukprot:gene5397-9210_t
MSKSGIQVPNDVSSVFNQVRQEEKVRWLQLVIEEETIKITNQRDVTDSFEDDYNSLSEAVDGPCYFVFRLDEKNLSGNRWLLIWYVPDSSKVKQKMLYSSTLETVKKDLGNSYFEGDHHTSLKSELSFENFSWESKGDRQKHLEEIMTNDERQVKEEKQESASFTTISSSGVRGVTFPITDDAKESMTSGEEIIVLKIEDETIQLDFKGKCSIEEISTKIESTLPRFIFWKYQHTFENEQLSTLFFIYSCPTSSKVKQRMVYSSSKSAMLKYASEFGLTIDQNLEVSDVSDLDYELLHYYVHPKKVEEVTFKKPTRPGKKKK